MPALLVDVVHDGARAGGALRGDFRGGYVTCIATATAATDTETTNTATATAKAATAVLKAGRDGFGHQV